MNKVKQFIGSIGIIILNFLMVSLPAWAQTGSSTSTGSGGGIGTAPPSVGASTASAQDIATQAGNVITFLDNTIHLAAIQAIVVVVIIGLTIKKAIAASHNESPQKLWTSVAFGVVGVVLTINPVILIILAIWVGSIF